MRAARGHRDRHRGGMPVCRAMGLWSRCASVGDTVPLGP
jgi:hypothetical protein